MLMLQIILDKIKSFFKKEEQLELPVEVVQPKKKSSAKKKPGRKKKSK